MGNSPTGVIDVSLFIQIMGLIAIPIAVISLYYKVPEAKRNRIITYVITLIVLLSNIGLYYTIKSPIASIQRIALFDSLIILAILIFLLIRTFLPKRTNQISAFLLDYHSRLDSQVNTLLNLVLNNQELPPIHVSLELILQNLETILLGGNVAQYRMSILQPIENGGVKVLGALNIIQAKIQLIEANLRWNGEIKGAGGYALARAEEIYIPNIDNDTSGVWIELNDYQGGFGTPPQSIVCIPIFSSSIYDPGSEEMLAVLSVSSTKADLKSSSNYSTFAAP